MPTKTTALMSIVPATQNRDVGRREVDAADRLSERAGVGSSAEGEGHGDQRQLDVVSGVGNAVQAL